MGLSENSARSLIVKKLGPNQKLLAVSKLQPIEKIRELYKDGQTDFAENYIQEALEKIEKLQDCSITWHLIGPIQKNKVKLLKKNFSYIHSIDSLALAEKVSEQAQLIDHVQKVFIQINLSGEVSKSGFSPEGFAKDWLRLKELRGIEVLGLMTMPPLENEPEKNRVFFRDLKYIGSKLDLREYSMGTSHDFQIALDEGATWIRLGTMLFGERTPKKVQKRGLS